MLIWRWIHLSADEIAWLLVLSHGSSKAKRKKVLESLQKEGYFCAGFDARVIRNFGVARNTITIIGPNE
jgi:hypothetical protein